MDADFLIADRVVVLLTTIQSPAAIAAACVDKLGVAPDQVDAVIDAARRRITLAADYHRHDELGQAITRLNALYGKAFKARDLRTALQCLKELAKLMDLYRPPPPASGSTTAGSADDGSAAELAAVREHLEPLCALGIAPAETSTCELARLAVGALVGAPKKKRPAANKKKPAAKRKRAK